MEPTIESEPATRDGGRVTALTIAACASIGAGAVHASAVGSHRDAGDAALVFAIVAVVQVLWGVAVLLAQRRPVIVAGALANVGFVVAWIVAKTDGLAFVDGLDTAESPQLSDLSAAALAALSAIAVVAWIGRGSVALPRLAALGGIAAILALTGPGLATASTHAHAHDVDGAAADHHDHAADDHHDPDPVVPADAPEHDHTDEHGAAAAVAPKPYDPTMPIDLGGVEGVTPQQQAAAENLIAITLLRLPKYADTAAAEADGFHSIRDAATGHEHYINWDYIDDGEILNPDRPESLVYEMRNGEKTLVSAMYMLGTGTTLDDVPDLGGPLTQWHIHDNLCFSPDPVAPVVAGLTNPDGTCSAPLQKFLPVPMIHVWIVPHVCGPFAALEGVGAGQIAEGEERLCDHAHGA